MEIIDLINTESKTEIVVDENGKPPIQFKSIW